ncbi:MAG TPA: hypothetical protein VNL15_06355 [Dehalococcoidia bacterium]|nr:hypothetical protein [Dehalococcoidia bacterium]
MSRALRLDPLIADKVEEHQEELARKAEKLARGVGSNKEGQLRNILAIAEESRSWALVDLFMRYQAGRGQLDPDWTRKAISELEELKQLAKNIAQDRQQEVVGQVHLELVKRVLGYTIWWYVWLSKGESKGRGERS